jgi:ATP-dependent RNA helicase DHX57
VHCSNSAATDILHSSDHCCHAVEQASVLWTNGEEGWNEEVGINLDKIPAGCWPTRHLEQNNVSLGAKVTFSSTCVRLTQQGISRDTLPCAGFATRYVTRRSTVVRDLTAAPQNFINASTVRDINSLRQDFLASLSELGYVPSNKRDLATLNTNSDNENLLKAILTGAFYPRVAMIRPPDARFEKIQAGSLVKEVSAAGLAFGCCWLPFARLQHEAKEVKFFDEHGRVFIVRTHSGCQASGSLNVIPPQHPASILFSEPNLKLGYLTYFHKAETSKPFLFDATEVCRATSLHTITPLIHSPFPNPSQIPLFALLLFGGTVTVNHFAGGLVVGKNGHTKLKAWARIGVLVNQVRRLLDAKLDEAIESVEMRGGVDVGPDVVKAILTLLA